MIAADVYRPAAIDQLKILGKDIDVPVFSLGVDVDPVEIVRQGLEEAKDKKNDYVIIDTAGRLQIDEKLMQELSSIKELAQPDEILLTVDAMTGQNAVEVAKGFNDQLDVTGVVLTKLDGDTRGGAALSIRAVTGKPIKFIGQGKKMTDLDVFYPDRMASRILGMGDVLSLIEKAQEAVTEEEMKEMEKKFKENSFTFDDYLKQLDSIKKMGNIKDVLSMIPGIGGKIKNLDIDENQMLVNKAIIQSMTPAERRNPDIIKASRRARIAKGSGTSIQQVNQLLRQFEQSKEMMKQLKSGKFRKMF